VKEGLWYIIKTVTITIVAWSCGVALLALLMSEAWSLGPESATGHALSFAAAFGALASVVIIGAAWRIAATGPGLTAEVYRDTWTKRLKVGWSIIIWPPR